VSSIRGHGRRALRLLANPNARWLLVALVLSGILLGLSACGSGSSSSSAGTTGSSRSAAQPDHGTVVLGGFSIPAGDAPATKTG